MHIAAGDTFRGQQRGDAARHIDDRRAIQLAQIVIQPGVVQEKGLRQPCFALVRCGKARQQELRRTGEKVIR